MIINSFSYSDVDHFWLNESRRWGEFTISREISRLEIPFVVVIEIIIQKLEPKSHRACIWRNKGSSLVHRSSDIDMNLDSFSIFGAIPRPKPSDCPESHSLTFQLSWWHHEKLAVKPIHTVLIIFYQAGNATTSPFKPTKKKNHVVSPKPTDG